MRVYEISNNNGFRVVNIATSKNLTVLGPGCDSAVVVYCMTIEGVAEPFIKRKNYRRFIQKFSHEYQQVLTRGCTYQNSSRSGLQVQFAMKKF
jgi:hypothetical protein